MRRFIAAVILVVIPLQFAYSAAASYCGDAGRCVPEHMGHHQCGQDGAPSQPDDSGAPVHDCGICHLSHAQAHPSIRVEGAPDVEVVPALPTAFSPDSRSPEPLERPPRAAPA